MAHDESRDPATDPTDRPTTENADRMDQVLTRLAKGLRGRHRESAHVEAHDEEYSDAPNVGSCTDHPLVSPQTPVLVTTDAELTDLIAELRESPGGFAYDSEFIGESSYFPKLCLIQVATTTRVALIDPLAGVNLMPFWQLVADPGVRKLVHAGEQDLEPVVRVGGAVPANVIDTQIAAGMAAMAYPISLTRLVGAVCDVELAKGMTFTQWDQRPLSKKQLHYAADDVRYLPAIWAYLQTRLDDQRLAWLRQECDQRCEPVRHSSDPAQAWRRVRGTGGLDGRQMALLKELAAWRDEQARQADLPPRALIKDEVLVAMVRRPPKTVEQLKGIKHMPKPLADAAGELILQILRRAKELQPLPMPDRPPEQTPEERFEVDAVWALVQTLCCGRGLDPMLVVSRTEVGTLLRRRAESKSIDRHPLMTGWRREAVGGDVLEMLRDGRTLSVRWQDGQLRVD